MNLPKWMSPSNIKQGAEQIEEPKDYNKDEYEVYIDPKCGCQKYRKKIKTEENETDDRIPENGIK